MAAVLVVLLLICVYGMKIFGPKEFNKDYLSKNNTTAVKGIFVFLVFMSHFIQYCPPVDAYDAPYKAVRLFLGQLVVVMFFFYSGYGIYESIKRKGTSYIKTFPVNRFLKTLLHLDIAILIFVIRNIIMGIPMTFVNVLLSFIGWKSVGNSNWFMFTVLILYFAVYLSFIIFKKNNVASLLLSTVLCIVYIVVMANWVQSANYWYNTALCLPLGLWYSYFKDKIELGVMKNDITYHITLFATFGLFMLAHFNKLPLTIYICWTLLFTLLVIFITMKVNFGNKVLYWLGNHVFSVYILQRLPLSVFNEIEAISSNRYLFFVLSFGVTAILAELFDRATGALDKVLFKKRTK